MDKYIVTKPVRFDRDYGVGETIPSEVINPHSLKRLMDAGKIALAPRDTLLDGSKEETVAFLEDILGVNFDDRELPDLEARAAACKEIIVEIMNAVSFLKENELSKPETEDERILGKEPDSQSADGVQETLLGVQNDTEDQGVGEHPHDMEENSTDVASDGEIGGNVSLICDICGKVCGSKAALTTHMKTHENK